MHNLLVAGLTLLALVVSGSAHARIAAPATVTHGDSIWVSGSRIRLFGIDAPESQQLCLAGGQRWRYGLSATRSLRKVIAGRPVVCTERDRDSYGRVVAVCHVNGQHINASMVSQGMAVAYTKYSRANVG